MWRPVGDCSARQRGNGSRGHVPVILERTSDQRPKAIETMNISRDVAEDVVPRIYEYFGTYADIVRLLRDGMPEKDFKQTMNLLGECYSPMDSFLKGILEKYPDLADR